MKRIVAFFGLSLVMILCFAPLTVWAQADGADLVIRQIKVSGEEQVVLQATSDGVELGDYWMGYVSQGVDPNTIVPSLRLPSFTLEAGQAVVLLSEPAETCDAVLMMELPFDFAVTRGTLVLKQLLPPDNSGNLIFTTRDSADWAKPSASATTDAKLDLRRESGASTMWYRAPEQQAAWRVGSLEGCTLTLAPAAGTTEPETITWTVEAVEPVAIIEHVNEVETASGNSAIPGENAGLAPPLITELLPNPQGTGTDASDEYIELYNSNDTTFDLSGFILQTGLATKHSYAVPSGTIIAPRGFIALYSRDTGLSMSNTSGQATLLDRSKTAVTQSDPYDSAPDGQSWALANGVWYWTTKATPAVTNVIAQPIVKPATGVKKLTTKASTTKKAAAKTKAASTKKAKASTTKSAKTQEVLAASSNQPARIPGPVPIHPGVLATVLACAIGYGVYVYRKDIANAIYKLRKH